MSGLTFDLGFCWYLSSLKLYLTSKFNTDHFSLKFPVLDTKFPERETSCHFSFCFELLQMTVNITSMPTFWHIFVLLTSAVLFHRLHTLVLFQNFEYSSCGEYFKTLKTNKIKTKKDIKKCRGQKLDLKFVYRIHKFIYFQMWYTIFQELFSKHIKKLQFVSRSGNHLPKI